MARTGVVALVALWAVATALPSALAQTTSYDPVSYLKGKGAGPTYDVVEMWDNFKEAPNHDEIVAASPDIWAILPEPGTLEKGYRNPCWTNKEGVFRCLPYFHVSGVSKCGTTDIYARLLKHPDMAAAVKGPHWWDECVYPPQRHCIAVPSADFDGYVRTFRKAAQDIKKRPEMITGEASSGTFTGVYTYVRGVAAARGVNITLAQLMYEAAPYTRFIVMFRDPVSRYHSAFHYYSHLYDKSAPYEPPENLHKRVKYEIQRWNTCNQNKTRYECIKGFSPQQLIKGMYGEFFDGWFKVFPKEQFLFLRNEDYQVAQREHLEVIVNFLGLRKLSAAEWDTVMASKKVNSQAGKIPEMWPETRKMLQEFYGPFNQKLADILGDERYTWKDVYSKPDPSTPGGAAAAA